MLPEPKAVLFDFADTVLVEEAFLPAAGLARLLELAEPSGTVGLEELIAYERAILKDLMPRKQASLLELPWQAVFRMLSDRFGLTFRLSLPEIEWEFWKATERMKPAPCIEAVLKFFMERKIPMSIVSNSRCHSETLLRELDQHGLRHYFRFLMSSADYGLRKPHPLLFQTAAYRLGFTPSEIWFVGDALETDIAGAIGAGMTAIWYNPRRSPQGEIPPHAESHEWEEILSLFPSSCSA